MRHAWRRAPQNAKSWAIGPCTLPHGAGTAMSGGFLSFLQETFAVAAEDGPVDLVFGKNEAIFGGVVGFSFCFVHFRDVQEVVQVAFLAGPADFLELAELDDGPFELAGGALAVHAQVG